MDSSKKAREHSPKNTYLWNSSQQNTMIPLVWRKREAKLMMGLLGKQAVRRVLYAVKCEVADHLQLER